MRGKRLRGLTWGHRRAIDPLVAATDAYEAKTGRPGADWAVRDLRAFEHQPLAEAVAQCDLLVFDHPFVGEVATSGLFLPVDDCVVQADADFAGPSLATYRWGGRLWGAPVDAATMNAVYRADLLSKLDAELPKCWDDVVALGERARARGLWLGLANGDHHGFLAIGSMMHNAGKPWHGGDGHALTFDIEAFRSALEAMVRIGAFSHPLRATSNAIALHDAMSSRDDIVYCPLTYGYATYGEADFGDRRLSFGSAPGRHAPYAAGTLIGGAGVGITSICGDVEAAHAYVAFLMETATQDDVFAHSHGQPATASAWSSNALDRLFNGYFSSVGETLRSAAVRPRFTGYGAFERAAGRVVGDALGSRTTIAAAVSAVAKLAEAAAQGQSA